MNNNTPVYDYEDAINFIAEKCDIDKDTIEKILMLEEDYMRSIGIISNEEPAIEWNETFNQKKGDKLCVILRVGLFLKTE